MPILQVFAPFQSQHINYQEKVGAWLHEDTLFSAEHACGAETQTISKLDGLNTRLPGLCSSKTSADFIILDEETDVSLVEETAKTLRHASEDKKSGHIQRPSCSFNRRSSMFAQPAQKIPLITLTSGGDSPSHRKSRTSGLLAHRGHHEARNSGDTGTLALPQIPECHSIINRQPRRRTLFMPSENTIELDVNPERYKKKRPTSESAQSDMVIDLARIPDSSVKTGSCRPRRGPRESLAKAPKRAPLGTKKAQQNSPNSQMADLRGTGPGKENLPPEYVRGACKGTSLSSARTPKAASSSLPRRIVMTQDGKAATKDETNMFISNKAALHSKTLHSKAHKNQTPQDGSAAIRSQLEPHMYQYDYRFRIAKSVIKDRTLSATPKLYNAEQANSAQSMCQNSSVTYCDIPETLGNSMLLEDQWSTPQAIAMSSLVNPIFETTSSTNSKHAISIDIRDQLTTTYRDPQINLLLRRLDASLQFGALCISRQALRHVSRIKTDPGHRSRFLELWLKTYDHRALQVAAEVVLTQTMGASHPLSSTRTSHIDRDMRQADPKEVEYFLRAFLIDDADISSKSPTDDIQAFSSSQKTETNTGDAAYAWRQMVLRSLMLILLLDRAKCEGILHGCLFQSSALCKSSLSVVLAITKILLPSIGHVSHTLSHLNYEVNHIQHFLDEYRYRVQKLDVNLHDEIKPMHLVETFIAAIDA